MTLLATIAAFWLTPIPDLQALSNLDLRHLREDVSRIEGRLELIEGAGPAQTQLVSNHLASLEAHLHLLRAYICEACTPAPLEPSVYDAIEESCGAGFAVTSSLRPEEYATLMRKKTHWMISRIGHMKREKYFERKRLTFGYYEEIRKIIARAKPICRATQGGPDDG